MQPTHTYEVRSRHDKRGVDLISDVLPFGGLRYGEPHEVANAIGYAKFFIRSHAAVIRVFDQAGNVIDARSIGRFQIVVKFHAFRGEPRTHSGRLRHGQNRVGPRSDWKKL